MSDFRFVVVSWDTNGRERDREKFVEALNKANDWIEFRENTWLVWTKQSSKTWYNRLKPHIGDRDNVFVVAADISDRGGWMPRAFWDFVRSKSST
ncbi:hypothetical protein [Devosia sp. Root436]|uniref:hypothetical protein n=1 Tax=Devosia sp. Root436 TaxID=1736537 RepID=UPI0012E33170|nr:hypothetical protein [Devosia sp. Root436]